MACRCRWFIIPVPRAVRRLRRMKIQMTVWREFRDCRAFRSWFRRRMVPRFKIRFVLRFILLIVGTRVRGKWRPRARRGLAGRGGQLLSRLVVLTPAAQLLFQGFPRRLFPWRTRLVVKRVSFRGISPVQSSGVALADR